MIANHPHKALLKIQGEEQHFHSLCSYFLFKTIFLLCSVVDSPRCFPFLHQSDQPTDHLFLGSQVSLILTYISIYVHDDRAKSYVSLRRISPMALPSPSPGHSPVVILPICTSIMLNRRPSWQSLSHGDFGSRRASPLGAQRRLTAPPDKEPARTQKVYEDCCTPGSWIRC